MRNMHDDFPVSVSIFPHPHPTHTMLPKRDAGGGGGGGTYVSLLYVTRKVETVSILWPHSRCCGSGRGGGGDVSLSRASHYDKKSRLL